MTHPGFPVSDHCDGELFFNPYASAGRSVGDLIRWWRTRARTTWPESLPLAPHEPPPARASLAAGHLALTSIGHATFLIQTRSLGMLTDPVFTTHAGPFGRLGPRRVRPPGVQLEKLPRVDLVLLSHNHYDHLQPSSLRGIAVTHRPLFVVPLGLGRFLSRLGIDRAIELDWWKAAEPAEGVHVTCVPAQHFSARSPRDRNRSLWAGFVVRAGDASIYFAGDTGYSPQFAEIGRRIGRIDLALLPIGAYEPRWFMQPAHVNPAEAVQIHRDVGARRSIGMHYGTFHLTDEPFDEPVRLLAEARAASGVPDDEFTTMETGETRLFGVGGREGI